MTDDDDSFLIILDFTKSQDRNKVVNVDLKK